MNDREELERLLDEGISSYARQEPRLGFEETLLRRLKTEPRRRAWLLFAAPALAVAILLLVMMVPRPPVAPAPLPVVTRAKVASPSVAPKQIRVLAKKRTPTPKADRVLAPLPLTEEEKALLTLAAMIAKQEIEPPRHDQGSLEPIRIEPIEIKPLNGGE